MNLNIEILEITNDVNDYENQKVRFACYDNADISFIAEMSIALASFLVSNSAHGNSAFHQFVNAIDSQGLENLAVGQEFQSVDE